MVFPADVWEDVMGYRCRDACGLAAAAVAKARGSVMPDSGDDEIDSDGDVELGDFQNGKSRLFVVVAVVVVVAIPIFAFQTLVRLMEAKAAQVALWLSPFVRYECTVMCFCGPS